jgi:hypothetical protein
MSYWYLDRVDIVASGAKIRPTGVAWRTWQSVHFVAGIMPSPGLAPWAILICSLLALVR